LPFFFWASGLAALKGDPSALVVTNEPTVIPAAIKIAATLSFIAILSKSLLVLDLSALLG
jgi:hypothetical protein